MNISSIKEYFVKGFTFANKNLDLLLYGLFIITLIFILDLFPQLPFKTIISLVVSQLSFGYFFSLPLILVNRQKKVQIKPKEIISTIVDTSKRLIWPAVSLTIAFIGLMIIGMIIFVIASRSDRTQVTKTIENYLLYFRYYVIIFSLTTPIVVFNAIFFALEKLNFFSAFAKAVVYCFRNISFAILIVIPAVVYNALRILVGFDNQLFSFIGIIIYEYYLYFITVVSLFYYQKNPYNRLS